MLHVHFLDVGQGDAILVVSPEGAKALIDGGPHVQGATRALGRHLSGRDRDLDLVVLTHPDEDHLGGLPAVLDRYDVDAVADTGVASTNALYLEWERAVDEEAPRRVMALQGRTIALGASTFLRVLNPEGAPRPGMSPDLNDASVAIHLVHGGVSFLLTGDIESGAEGRLLRSGQDLGSTVLKVPHHGSRSSSTAAFLAAVAPRAAVISAGAENPYGHPHPEVLQRLEALLPEERLYSTALHGGRGVRQRRGAVVGKDRRLGESTGSPQREMARGRWSGPCWLLVPAPAPPGPLRPRRVSTVAPSSGEAPPRCRRDRRCRGRCHRRVSPNACLARSGCPLPGPRTSGEARPCPAAR